MPPENNWCSKGLYRPGDTPGQQSAGIPAYPRPPSLSQASQQGVNGRREMGSIHS